MLLKDVGDDDEKFKLDISSVRLEDAEAEAKLNDDLATRRDEHDFALLLDDDECCCLCCRLRSFSLVT